MLYMYMLCVPETNTLQINYTSTKKKKKKDSILNKPLAKTNFSHMQFFDSTQISVTRTANEFGSHITLIISLATWNIY